jgi:hypothetical protein
MLRRGTANIRHRPDFKRPAGKKRDISLGRDRAALA